MKLIAFVYLLHFTRYGMIFPLIPLYAQELGCSSAIIGLVVGSFSLLSLFLALPIGDLTDRFGAKWIMLGGVVCNIVSSWLLVIADSVLLLLASQIIGGMGFLLLVVSSQAYVGRLKEIWQRERGFALLTFSAAIGQAVGPYWGCFLLSRYDFGTAFGTGLLLALLSLGILGLREKAGEASQPLSSCVRDRADQFRAYWSDRTMVATLLFSFVVVFAVSLRSSFIPVLFKAEGLDESSIGLLLSISACSMTLVRFVVAWLMGRFSRSVLAGWAMGSVCLGVALLPAGTVMLVLVIIMIVFGCGFGISQPLSMVMVSDRAAPGFAGLAMGIRFMTVMSAALLSPLVLGFVVEGFGLDAAFHLASGLLFLAGAWIVNVLRKST